MNIRPDLASWSHADECFRCTNSVTNIWSLTFQDKSFLQVIRIGELDTWGNLSWAFEKKWCLGLTEDKVLEQPAAPEYIFISFVSLLTWRKQGVLSINYSKYTSPTECFKIPSTLKFQWPALGVAWMFFSHTSIQYVRERESNTSSDLKIYMWY